MNSDIDRTTEGAIGDTIADGQAAATGLRPARELGPAQFRRIVALARLAPSVHNTQPWWWQVSGTSLELWADRERGLPVSDPLGRNLVISCGAALHHTAVAAEAVGARAQIEYLPKGADSDLMARIDLVPHHPSVEALARLTMLGQRHTDRRRFTSWPVPDESVAHLAEEGRRWGASVLAVTDRALRVEIEDLLEEARRRQQGDPRISDETEAWIDHDVADGVPSATVPRFDGARGERPTRFDSSLVADTTESVVRGTDGLLVVSTPDDGPLSWLHAGASLSALWLLATGHGLSVVPLSQAVEVERTRLALERLLPAPSRVPQILARVGWQEIGRGDLPRSPRRPVDELLRGLSRPA
jgi:hypothetical protein